MTAIPSRVRSDILRDAKNKHAAAMRAARWAEATGNSASAEYWLGRAGELWRWIVELERDAA